VHLKGLPSVRICINPRNIRLRAIWRHKYIFWCPVCPRLIGREHYRHIPCNPTSQVIARASRIIFCHKSIVVVISCCWVCGPLLVTLGIDAGIQICIEVYTTVLCIPRTTEIAFAGNRGSNGTIRCIYKGVGDVDTIFVGEGGVRSFPGRDSTTTALKLDPRVLDPSGPET
jgi:hypothetical protein